jgi:molybdate transport system substrate-binding protein
MAERIAALANPRPVRILAAVLLAVCVTRGAAESGEVSVAVAANFTDAANEIADLFERKTGHEALFSFGSTGQLYTQITQEAPFEVFLSADQERPAKAVEDGFGIAGTVFTYATGKIVLFSMDADLVKGEDTLRKSDVTKMAIANPETAPYGKAAVETMKELGVYDALQPKLVQGSNIAQTYQFVATGNAELGFVALSQVASDASKGSRWVVPESLYEPIAQDAVLLKRGESSEAAAAFIDFLKSADANAVKEKYGYGAGG